jgi:glycosyltransferase involved in cell wall biosynthesis
MRILHLIGSVNPAHGGPVEGVVQSSLVWAKLGHEREIVSLDYAGDPWVKTCPIKVTAVGWGGDKYEKLRKQIPWLRYGFSPRLVPWVSANCGRFDAVIVNGLWNYVALGGLLALRGRDVPYLVYPHGMLDPWFKKTYPLKHAVKQILWLLSEGPLLRSARYVIFTSEEERIACRDAFWPYRLNERVLSYGTADPPADRADQIEMFWSAFPQLRERRFILFLSRIHKKKGVDLLIRAFARVAGQQPDVHLVIAGPDLGGWRPQLEDLAKREGIGNRVVWPGMLKDKIKWGAFRAAEAVILPSHQENFGIAVAEAMACARPVLISNKVNIWREVASSKSGIVAADDLAGTEDLLQQFFRLSVDEREAMGIAARRCFLQKFEIERAAQELLALLEDIAHERPSHGHP